MIKILKKLIKKCGKAYISGYYKLNKPMLDAGLTPFI